MSNYLVWDKKTLTDFSAQNITELYEQGFASTREHKGSMYKTRSLRIDLEKFDLSSENRRILKKTQGLVLEKMPLPLPSSSYDWKIHKLGKDFYEQKFGAGVFSASKIKELLTDGDKSNFNYLYKYSYNSVIVGYAIVYENERMIHYAYPFYDLEKFVNNFGMGMMLTAILEAQKTRKKYCYLGSASKPEDKYKLQFEGLEWFDSNKWQVNIKDLKDLLN